MGTHRGAFTLAEVAFSLLILTVAVLATMALLPIGLQVQQRSRYQMHVAAKAQEIIDQFAQHQVDFKDRFDQAYRNVQDDGNPESAVKANPLMTAVGQFDLERVVCNPWAGNYPVPTEIARRFDSPNGEIQKIIDDGGQIHYSDPFGLNRYRNNALGRDTIVFVADSRDGSTNTSASTSNGSADRGMVPEMQRVVWAVKGPAQANAVPFHPAAALEYQLYPFPPRARGRTIPHIYGISQNSEQRCKAVPVVPDPNATFDSPTGRRRLHPRLVPERRDANGRVIPPNVPEETYRPNDELAEIRGPGYPVDKLHYNDDPRWDGRKLDADGLFRPVMVRHYDFVPLEPGSVGPLEQSPESLPELNNWEWFADQDRKHGLDASSSKWIAGLPEFRRLVFAHWLRIHHQLAQSSQTSKRVLPDRRLWTGLRPLGIRKWDYIPVKDAAGNVVKDAAGNPVMQEGIIEQIVQWPVDENGHYIDCAWSEGFTTRGYPSPPIGLGWSKLRGTDILFEDAESWVRSRDAQLRFGMPSLERRVMYRTAALALWARVAPGGPYQIMPVAAAALDQASTLADSSVGDVNVAVGVESKAKPLSGNLPKGVVPLPEKLNPLLGMMEPPNPVDIHPTQVFALSHLAHAAMLVTGYKPPFYDDKGTIPANDDTDQVPEEKNRNVADRLPTAVVEDRRIIMRQDPPDRKTGVVPPPVEVEKKDLAHYLLNPFILGDSDPANDRQSTTTRPAAPNNRDIMVHPLDWDEDDSGPDPSVPGRNFDPIDLTNPRVGIPVIDDQARDARNPRFQRTPDGKPIIIRRRVETGQRLCLVPPPYADRGGFDIAGARTYDLDIQPGPDVAKVEEFRRQPLDPRVPAHRSIRWWQRYPLNPWPEQNEPIPQFSITYKTKAIRVNRYHGAPGEDTRWAREVHETCLRWAIAYTSENPHDYLVPKPANRMTMMDRGLYQLALFDDAGRARRTASMETAFGITYESTQARFGVAYAPPGPGKDNVTAPGFIDNNTLYRTSHANVNAPTITRGEYFPWGTTVDGPYTQQEDFQKFINRLHGHPGPGAETGAPSAAYARQATLFRPFVPAERARQLVFWVVDWKQYEDAETAPSAPIDQALLGRNGKGEPTRLMPGLSGNPELPIAWTTPLRTNTLLNWSGRQSRWQSGTFDNRHYLRDQDFRAVVLWNQVEGGEWGYGELCHSPAVVLGSFGADRNGNGICDRGPVPRTVRMKATEVGRFNFYDPIAYTNLRH